MKTLIFLTALFASNAFAFEWEAGLREHFYTKDTYSYDSDSTARLRRELFDRGYKRLSLHPRIEYTGDDRSLFIMPAIKSPLRNYAVMNSRVLQADGKLTLKPLIYSKPGLGEARPLINISPKRADIAFASYTQILNQFIQISRTESVDRLVVGAGIVHLLEDKANVPRLEAMLKLARKSIGIRTELVLEVTGDRDLKALMHASDPANGILDLTKLVDGISLVLEPEVHFTDKAMNAEEVRRSWLTLQSFAAGLPVHLSRIAVPSCEITSLHGAEAYCESGRDNKLQVDRFMNYKKAFIALEKDNVIFKTIEILESTTDFEPKNPEPRYPYYNPLFNDPLIYELPKKAPAILPPFPMPSLSNKKIACVYYDRNDQPPFVDRLGDIHSVMLESTLGAFKDWTVKRQRLITFRSGDASECSAIFYLATNFSQELPPGFTEELALLSNHVPVVWFNYKFPLFSKTMEEMNQKLSFNANILMQADTSPSRQNEDPGFFRFFEYKGETFHKLAKWDPISDNFSANPELHSIAVADPQVVEILSVARHSKKELRSPYAVRQNNIWYFADSPFSFVHYEDRYLIFADLLWDILQETPPTERIALVRLEDINAKTDMESFNWAVNYLGDNKIPFAVATIPFYSDIIGSGAPDFRPEFRPMRNQRSFVSQLKNAKARGGSIVMHGVLHSVGSLISGYDGICGADYEFWLYPENKPLPFDSIDWVTRRLELGIKELKENNLDPVAFEVPHYAASVMNYVVFGKMFRWNYHRTIYFPFTIISDTALPDHLKADCDPQICGDERRAVLSNLRIEADYAAFGGVTLPFITHRDAYGQSLIPETLGMIDFAFYDPHTWRPVGKPEDIIRRAKKLKVVRGAVASFFWHPQNLNSSSRYYQEVPGSYEAYGGKKSLELVINGLKKLGYEFKSIEDRTLFPLEDAI